MDLLVNLDQFDLLNQKYCKYLFSHQLNNFFSSETLIVLEEKKACPTVIKIGTKQVKANNN